MRLRKKWWARPELDESPFFKSLDEARELKGNWKNEFKNDNEIYLELGCGRGGFAVQLARKFSDKNLISIDLKDEVLVYTLRNIVNAELTNVRVIAMNIGMISEIFDENEISRIYINFCNPWPKDRHNKRRLTHTRFLTEYKKFIKPGTEVHFKTDDLDLFNDSLVYFEESGFDILYKTYDLHNSDYASENLMTEYESKFKERGIKSKFLIAKLK
ncbi:tRNA (guanosine(46)-N7)-methyltransferase TrmB [Clostridium botulinum]|uniref:tRNA (guanosine(46)-N7)-methyltransferase TrmB n=1 Tax=Clostridium botulinum TaxID=1491 RepID=UPI00052B9C97|nr:tRNA (guanosine(46)-N7)-methyltransferase TrmB [Clostridium botulinum]KGM93284.1 tRNA (guanine-N7)-methyltransferase [Clostridium botulinum D str. CCUG 7971]KOC49344.1 tRNA (guanine-N7)-methyltransferase [Clostridium botulinum]MCD3350978.1 tRNA (guanosine(46)-N7)-methyltransferase TrmB [Clostridium botulinum D/C]MCD3359934.1 tRNA (guanosine(46)-N7)-methyltransferase TrmB [Clostridium botulinum D/C]MCD3361655.1 tRNA (guanosine(46)-N7)-methyltransferase TrmB [Clostridium botulinum D/C]